MLTVRFLRFPLYAVVTSSPARIPSFGKFSYSDTRLKLERVTTQLLYSVPRFSRGNFVSQRIRQYAKKLCNSGSKLTIGSMVVCSAFGSMSLRQRIAYCADGSHIFADHHQTNSWGAPRSDEKSLARSVLLMEKLIVPLFLLLTILLKWGQSHPLFLTARVVLIFIFTKPIPSSVHIFVDQLQRQIMSQQPFLYRSKPLHVNRVDVVDYPFLCLARVHIKDEKLLLIGILGSWWISPLSSWEEVFLFDKLSCKELISLVKSRFRLAAQMSFC